MRCGHVFWLFGLSGAGKTTLASRLGKRYAAEGIRSVLLLDGDILRAGLCSDLGFTDEGRTENIRRAAEIAKLAMLQGHMVIAAFITPREEMRAMARAIIGVAGIDLIWINASLETCRLRDPKGHYRRSDAGGLPLFTGVDSVFEAPPQCHLRLSTEGVSEDHAAQVLFEHCQARLSSQISS